MAVCSAGITLPYPQQKFAAEFVVQWLFLLVEPTRMFLGEHSKAYRGRVPPCNRLQQACEGTADSRMAMQWTCSNGPAAMDLQTDVCWAPCFPSTSCVHSLVGSVWQLSTEAAHVLPLCNQQKLNAQCTCCPAGSKGNKTEQSGPLLFSVLLCGPMVAFFVYYLHFQTYV